MHSLEFSKSLTVKKSSSLFAPVSSPESCWNKSCTNSDGNPMLFNWWLWIFLNSSTFVHAILKIDVLIGSGSRASFWEYMQGFRWSAYQSEMPRPTLRYHTEHSEELATHTNLFRIKLEQLILDALDKKRKLEVLAIYTYWLEGMFRRSIELLEQLNIKTVSSFVIFI